MLLNIVRIGNSKGLRLSKTILDKYNINDKVELVLQEDHIILKPVSNPREGWEEQFRQMNLNGDDELLIPDLFDDEELPEWK